MTITSRARTTDTPLTGPQSRTQHLFDDLETFERPTIVATRRHGSPMNRTVIGSATRPPGPRNGHGWYTYDDDDTRLQGAPWTSP